MKSESLLTVCKTCRSQKPWTGSPPKAFKLWRSEPVTSPTEHCDLEKTGERRWRARRIHGRHREPWVDAERPELQRQSTRSTPGTRQELPGCLPQTVEAASKLGLDTVVTMSGCPGEPGGCEYPNWVLHPWQKEYLDLYEWQWDQVIEPFWKQAGQFASDRGVKIAIEMHPASRYITRAAFSASVRSPALAWVPTWTPATCSTREWIPWL